MALRRHAAADGAAAPILPPRRLHAATFHAVIVFCYIYASRRFLRPIYDARHAVCSPNCLPHAARHVAAMTLRHADFSESFFFFSPSRRTPFISVCLLRRQASDLPRRRRA